MNHLSKRAFTLTEMLVAAPVAMLLGTMLLAVSNDAKQQLQAAACLNNMRQWGLGFMLYANDYNDSYPYDGNYTAGLICGVGTWFDVVPPYIGQKSLCNLYAAGTPPTPLTKSIWICPSATNVTVQPTLSVPYFTYSMTVCYHRRTSARSSFRRNEATSPSTTILFCEESEDSFGETRGDADTVTRHFGGSNFVFWDGHAGWLTYTNFCRNCAAHPFQWDDSTVAGDWKATVQYHWWPFANASMAQQ